MLKVNRYYYTVIATGKHIICVFCVCFFVGQVHLRIHLCRETTIGEQTKPTPLDLNELL